MSEPKTEPLETRLARILAAALKGEDWFPVFMIVCRRGMLIENFPGEGAILMNPAINMTPAKFAEVTLTMLSAICQAQNIRESAGLIEFTLSLSQHIEKRFSDAPPVPH